MSSKHVPTYCLQCVCGPDLLTVEVDEEGEAVGVQPNFEADEDHPAHGRVCTKAYSLIDKVNNPKRLTQPLVRTNPEKGWDEDPEWEPIDWDEAISILAEKIADAQTPEPYDEHGYPRIAVSMGGGGITEGHFGTFPAVLGALDGYVDFSLGSGQGVACYHSEHVYGELWHRAFLQVPDIERTKYVVSFGANKQNTAGPAGNWRYAEAQRENNMRYVHVEPHATTSAGWADEWIPIKPKTDAVFLYAMLHVALHELDWRAMVDRDFLEERTNSPYLVAPNGYYLRDPDTEQPLVWDADAGEAKPFDDPSVETPALEGEYEADGVTVGPDDERETLEGVTVAPSFQQLLDHVADLTPEAAADICDVSAERIRRIATEFAETAAEHVGDTVTIEGVEMPYRPVAILLGKTVNNGWGGYQTTWARTVLCMLYGAIEVPGGLVSVGSRLNPPYTDKTQSVAPGEDGFMAQSLGATSEDEWPDEPQTRGGLTELTPLVGTEGWAQALSPSSLAWMFQRDAPEGWPEPSTPDVWMVYRCNPVISFPDTQLVADVVEDFPFTVSIAYTHDETNWFADLVLPDNVDLESLQLKHLGGHTHAMDSFWETQGYALKQPVVEPKHDTKELTELWTELMDELGMLEDYTEAINRGYIMGLPLAGEDYDLSLSPEETYEPEEVWDRICRAASRDLVGEEKDLEWFKENGYLTKPFPETKHFLHPTMLEHDLRYELPYQERIRRKGEELGRRLDEAGIDWWDDQLEEYEALPAPEDPSTVWEDFYGDDYDLWAVTTKSMHYAYSSNVASELSSEVARNTQEFEGVCLNPETAAERGIEPDDEVVVRSPIGEARGDVILREGVRPDTVLFVGQFGQSITPHAKNLRIPNINQLTTVDDLDLVDGTGSIAQMGRVTVEPAE
ncbi:MAG: molybdopterin-dependent oxidoreductase [Halobacteriales archaeon]